ncbi:hypothetical protein KBD45_07565 [Candidatus Dojkabacteria bacterium]|nr:hypothetical protein [Candidatus Dojkabacteria bacterium]
MLFNLRLYSPQIQEAINFEYGLLIHHQESVSEKMCLDYFELSNIDPYKNALDIVEKRTISENAKNMSKIDGFILNSHYKINLSLDHYNRYILKKDVCQVFVWLCLNSVEDSDFLLQVFSENNIEKYCSKDNKIFLRLWSNSNWEDISYGYAAIEDVKSSEKLTQSSYNILSMAWDEYVEQKHDPHLEISSHNENEDLSLNTISLENNEVSRLDKMITYTAFVSSYRRKYKARRVILLTIIITMAIVFKITTSGIDSLNISHSDFDPVVIDPTCPHGWVTVAAQKLNAHSEAYNSKDPDNIIFTLNAKDVVCHLSDEIEENQALKKKFELHSLEYPALEDLINVVRRTPCWVKVSDVVRAHEGWVNSNYLTPRIGCNIIAHD